MTGSARLRPPILALDQATRTGWAFLAPGAAAPESGSLALPDHGPAARIVAFEAWLWPRCAPLGGGQGLLVYEGPALVAGRGAPFRVGCHLESVILRVARAWTAPLLVITAPEAKKATTGSGNASKEQVRDAMRTRWARPDLEDLDEADALALLACAVAAWERGEVELPAVPVDAAEGEAVA